MAKHVSHRQGTLGRPTAANPLPVFGASGIIASASFTPAAAAYGAADIMDVAKEFSFTYANGLAIPSGSLIRILSAVVRIDITAVPSGQTSYALEMFSVTPPSAQADNDAFTLASGDLASHLGALALGTPVDKGAALYVKAGGLNEDVKLSGSSLFGRLVTAGAHTATAVARQIELRGIVL
jgi:hypothetical protein